MIDWLCKELSPEARVGVDPMLLSDGKGLFGVWKLGVSPLLLMTLLI